MMPVTHMNCPYCVEADGNFKVMSKGKGGVWYKCDRCGHIVMPENKLFECPCLKCFELLPPDPKQVKPRPH